MFHLKIQSHFAAAHNLMNYQGDCENLHGHNWRVEVEISARELDRAGLAVDFKVLKRETNRVLDQLDHKYLNEVKPFDELSPSSENISRYIFKELSEILNDGNVNVVKVTVWESDNACASFTAD